MSRGGEGREIGGEGAREGRAREREGGGVRNLMRGRGSTTIFSSLPTKTTLLASSDRL